jgi:hypothetical protein
VDSANWCLLGACDRFGDPRGGDAELARRIGEGQADLGHELDGQGAPVEARVRVLDGAPTRTKLGTGWSSWTCTDRVVSDSTCYLCRTSP